MIWTFLLAVLVSVYRIRRNLFSKGDVVLWSLFLLSILFVQLLLYAENFVFKTDLRYLKPSFVLLWPICVWPFSQALRKYRKLKYLFLAIFIVAFGVNAFRVIKHNFGIGNRSRKTLVSAWAADIINKDWTGPRKDDKLEWSVLEYNTMARPIISCASSYRSIAYLTGGRIYSPEIGGKNEVDYYLIENESPPPKSQLIGEYVFKKRRFRLYRTSLSFMKKEGKDGAVR